MITTRVVQASTTLYVYKYSGLHAVRNSDNDDECRKDQKNKIREFSIIQRPF